METIEQQLLAAVESGDEQEVARLVAIMDHEDTERQARLTAPDALASSALWYAQQGVPVFPLIPRTKVPFPKSRGFYDASTDAETVLAWWRRTPQANIGVATGHRFDVIDVDGPTGIAAIYGDRETFMSLPPVLGIASTPRAGGLHLYVPVTGRGNKTALLPGVDYRGLGGYVVLPPSVTDDHGAGLRYKWLQPLAAEPLCLVCHQRMIVIEPGQKTHPCCDVP